MHTEQTVPRLAEHQDLDPRRMACVARVDELLEKLAAEDDWVAVVKLLGQIHEVRQRMWCEAEERTSALLGVNRERERL